MTGTEAPGYFDRARIAAGGGAGRRRRRSMLFLLESWTGEPGSEVLDFLAGTELFGGLERPVLRELFAHLEPVHAAAGETVLDPDAVPDALLLVAHGRLAVRDGVGAVRDVGPGEVAGAAALLDDVAAGTGIRAARDSVVLRLTAESFRRFAAQHPSSLLGLCRSLVRSATARPPATDGTPGGERATGATLAVVAVGSTRLDAGPAADAVAGLVGALDALPGGGAVVVSSTSVDADLGDGHAHAEVSDARNGRLVARLHAVEAAHAHTVYRADDADSAWTRRCLRQADRVLLVADAAADPAPGPAERALRALPPGVRRDLLVVRAPDTAPSGTAERLVGRDVTRHHHVRRGDDGDLARVARHLTGRARGLVLAGGGMRGFAHLGVMRALDEAGIAVDAIGGASIGAIMAGFYAAGLDHEQRVRRATRAMVEQGSMVGFTLPLVAVSSGRKVTRLLDEEPSFSGAIEDLPLPYFCVSASLSRATEVVHESGPTARAIRASIAIPGVYPPVHAGDELLVDGGVINNLPVDVMARVVGDGPVVAVNLHRTGGSGGRRPPAEFEPGLSGWRVLASRLNPWTPTMRVPRLPDVLMRSLSLSTARLQRDRLGHREPELVLTPPVGTAGMLDFRAGPALVEPAYRYAVEALRETALRETALRETALRETALRGSGVPG